MNKPWYRPGAMRLRLLGIALMLSAGFVAAGPRGAIAQDDDSGLDDNTFTGPNFGWSVEWDEDIWAFDDEDNSGGGDYFSLVTVEGEPFALSQFFGAEEFGGDPDECVSGWEDFISNRDAVSDVDEDTRVELPETPDDGANTAYTYVSEADNGTEFDLIEYVACQTLVEDEAVLIHTVITTQDDFEDLIPLIDDLAAEIILPDNTRGRGDDEDEETPDTDATGIDGNEYVGPNFGWELTWDDDIWTVDAEDNSGGSDFISLESEDPSAFVLFLAIEDFDGDPDDCAEDWGDQIEDRGDAEDVEEATDLDVPDEPRGATGAAYTYSVEVRGGDTIDIVEYVQCYELVEGEAVLEVILQAPEDEYEDAIPLFEDLVDELELA